MHEQHGGVVTPRGQTVRRDQGARVGEDGPRRHHPPQSGIQHHHGPLAEPGQRVGVRAQPEPDQFGIDKRVEQQPGSLGPRFHPGRVAVADRPPLATGRRAVVWLGAVRCGEGRVPQHGTEHGGKVDQVVSVGPHPVAQHHQLLCRPTGLGPPIASPSGPPRSTSLPHPAPPWSAHRRWSTTTPLRAQVRPARSTSATSAPHRLPGSGPGRPAGRFLLRLEDIDTARCRPEFARAITSDLDWLGLTWDGPIRVQSHHAGEYAAVLDGLQARGLLYPCFCSRADIRHAATAPHGPEGLRYPGTCRVLSGGARAARLAAGQVPAWRLDMAQACTQAGPLSYQEEGQGRLACDPLAFGDVVLGRRDALASYHLAVTHDDAVQAVTLVTRGDDLRAATAVHRPSASHDGLGGTGLRPPRIAGRRGWPTLGEAGTAPLRSLASGPAAIARPRSWPWQAGIHNARVLLMPSSWYLDVGRFCSGG